MWGEVRLLPLNYAAAAERQILYKIMTWKRIEFELNFGGSY